MINVGGVIVSVRVVFLSVVLIGCGGKEATPCARTMSSTIDQSTGSGAEIPKALHDQWRRCKDMLKSALARQCSEENWSTSVIACFNDRAQQPNDCFNLLPADQNANSLKTIERVSVECQRDPVTKDEKPGNGRALNVEVSSTSMFGVVKLIIKNRDTFDLHNVTVCVNEVWCAADNSHAGAPSTNRTIKAGEEWALNWFMDSSIAYREAVRAGQIPGKGTISDFVNAKGSQNKANQSLNSVSVQADEGQWQQAY